MNFISISRTANGTFDGWLSGFSNYPDLQPIELQSEIDRKAHRVSGYETIGGRPWLLINADPVNAAQALDLTDDIRAATFHGPFERVFFVDCRDRAAELRIA